MTAAPTAMGCRSCGHLLNRFVDNGSTTIRYRHPAIVAVDDHEPDPVPVDQLDVVVRCCDFCGQTRQLLWTLHTHPISVLAITEAAQELDRYGTAWAACAPCAYLIRAGQAARLLDRTIAATGMPREAAAVRLTASIQQAVLDAVQPHRTLITMGEWDHTPVPPAVLPKVRDRLTGLLTGPELLPAPYDRVEVRAAAAAGLDQARLFWVDEDFTDEARAGATSLPPTPWPPRTCRPHTACWSGPAPCGPSRSSSPPRPGLPPATAAW